MVVNAQVNNENEPCINYGRSKQEHAMHVYSTRASYPDEEILTAVPDVTGEFLYPKIHPDSMGAFGNIIGADFCITTAMVFGCTLSALSWEHFGEQLPL